GQREGAKLPKVYYVNWFRKSDGGDFLWPGFGENGRVLKWIFERCEGTAKAIETPIGNLPDENTLDLSGLDGVSREDMAALLRVDIDGWLAELPLIEEYYAQFGDRLPEPMSAELAAMKSRLEAAQS
ncbi:MAG: phosphoenolpyruvate carboxykinase domain-containing protein, partial [Myxococcota bacterium]